MVSLDPHGRYRLLVLLMLAAPAGQAQQLVDVRDGVTVEALLSTREATRIRIDGAAITSVVGALQSGSCDQPTKAAGNAVSQALPSTTLPIARRRAELAVECDSDKGEIYVRPLGNGSKPVNLFVASPHGSYTLLLKRLDIPADTITLRPRATGSSSSSAPGPLGRSPNPLRQMKALLIAMALQQPAADIEVEEVGRELRLWQDSQLTLLRRYRGRGLIGERLQLRNTGSQTMVVAEQEFDRAEDQVLGIAVEQHTLAPGEATAIFVIRLDGGRP